MFSVHSHNQQILFHLSQITPRRNNIALTKKQHKHAHNKKQDSQTSTLSSGTAIFNIIKNKNNDEVLQKQQQSEELLVDEKILINDKILNNKETTKQYNNLCTESLTETAKNLENHLTLNLIKNLTIDTILNNNNNTYNINNIYLNLKNNSYDFLIKKVKPTLYCPWHISHISTDSFVKNKIKLIKTNNEDRHIKLQKNINMRKLNEKNINVLYKNILNNFLITHHVGYTTQFRSFKTDRSMDAELKRNPTISTRFKEAFAGPTTKFDSQTFVNVNSNTSSSSAQQSQNEAFNKLLLQADDKTLTTEHKQRLKIAFAEGYLAAANTDGQQKSSRAMKYLKVFQQVLIIVVFLVIFFNLFTSTNGSVFRIQLGNQVEVDPEEINVTFDDVKGCDEAKQELKEIVEFLKNPEKFSNLGGKLPKGVLLVGPPGTGKTLLARAVAGEAGVPFFHAAGPEFDEVLVGQGARRVRDLFKAAKERAPCVIFIDEIDSVGSKRTNSVLHPYANQTINQLLSEMDGFLQNEGVIVLGATNRRDDLDQALLRPGRFDVEVVVPTPDYSGRKEIITLYLTKILHRDIDIDVLARGTTGFTGADLENMVNQAALRAAIDGAERVSMKHLESARDKVLMGPERKARLPDEEANKITAYHEGGHAIVAFYTKESHPLHKVTIMPRGPSLGHTAYIPEKERYHVTKAQLLAMMDTMMGGRAAEELIFGPEKITSGASSDLKQATSIAAHMVKDWGMSDKVGLRTIESPKGMMQGDNLGPNTIELVDAEIKKILNESYERAKLILKLHAKEHKALAEALLKYETLDADDIKAIMSGDGKLILSASSTKSTTPHIGQDKHINAS